MVIDVTALDQDRAFHEVELLVALGARDAGTARAERAASHIRERLEQSGISARIDTFDDSTPRGMLKFHNVVAEVAGKGEGLVVIGSHFDTKSGMPSGFQGANDSGSSTGLLIEMARVLHESPGFNFDIQLVFFDGEECIESYAVNDGLHGSRHHAHKIIASGRADEVMAVVVLDMIGDRHLDIRFPRNSSSSLVKTAFEAANRLGCRAHFGLAQTSIIDDHLPFYQAGMPAINLIDFNFGSRPGLNDYWHTAEDRLDKLSPKSLGVSGRVVLEMLNLLDN
jgi:Zn-dependent M28 family amino/carboxypeptidase